MPRLHVGSLLVLCACATTQQAAKDRKHEPAPEPADPGELAEGWMLPSRILDTNQNKIVSADQMTASLLEARVVYVGEQHHSPHDHAVQLHVIHMLREQDPGLAIGLEMVKRPFQSALDRYLAGEVDEEAFLEASEWRERWGYPFFLYRPILRYARKHSIPVFALNARDEITRTVGRDGLESLVPKARAALPELDLSNEAHKEIIRAVFDGHHQHGGSFDNFYTAQVIWDETMAYEVARILRADGAPNRIVVLAGGGHVRHGHGIPSRAAKRGATPHRTILPIFLKSDGPTFEEASTDPGGDFLWLMGNVDAIE